MFANLKNKLIEEVKASPSKFQQLANAAQAAVSSSASTVASGPESTTNENFFSITEEDTPQNSPNKPLKLPPAGVRGRAVNVSPQSINNGTTVSGGAIPRTRKLSNSSVASDTSFRLPSYESPAVYHLQSDWDCSASEVDVEESAPNMKLDSISKDQLYDAYKKSLDRYHKYRCRYTDLAKKYKDLERDSTKARSVLVETQEKAIRRISELREQCTLEQQAKAHLEEALRMEMDDMQCKMQAYQTKLKLLGENPEQITAALSAIGVSETTDQLIDFNSNENEKSNHSELSALSLESAVAKIKKLESQLEEREIQLREITQKYTESTAAIELLRKQEEENALLLAQTKQAIHSELESKDTEVKRLQDAIKKLQSELHTATKTENQFATQEVELSELRDKLKQTKGHIQELNAKVISTEHLLADLKEKYTLKERALSAAEENLQLFSKESEQKLSDIRQQNVQLSEMIERYQRNEVSLAEIDNELNRTKNENDQLKATLDEKLQKLQQLEHEINEQRMLLERTQKDYLDNEKQYNLAEHKIQEYVKQIEELQMEKQSEMQKVKQLQIEMRILKEQQTNTESETITALKDELRRTSEDLQGQANIVKDQLLGKEKELKSQMNKLNKQKKQCETQQTKIKEQAQEIEKLKGTLSDHEIHLQALQHEAGAREEQTEKEKNELRQQVTNILQEISQMEEQMQLVQQSHAELDQEKRNLEMKIETMQRQTQAANERQEQLNVAEEKLHQVEAKLQHVESENSQLAEKNCLLEENSHRLEKLIAERERQQTAEEANAIEMRLKLETAEGTIEKLNDKMAQVLDENSRMQNAQELMDHDFRTLQDKYDILEKEKLIAIDEQKVAEEKLQTLRDERAADEAKLVEIQKKLHLTEELLANLKTEKIDAKKELSELQEQQEAERILLRRELKDLKTSQQSDNNKMRNLLHEKQQHIDELLKKVKGLETADKELKALQEKLRNAERATEEIERKNEELLLARENIESLSKELKLSTAIVEEKKMQISTLEEHMIQLKENLKERQKQLEDLETKESEQNEKLQAAQQTTKELEQTKLIFNELNIKEQKLRKEVVDNKDKYNSEIEELKRRIKEAHNDSATLKASNTKYQEQIEKLHHQQQMQLKELETIQNSAINQKDLTDKLAHYEQLHIENEYLNKHVKQLENDLAHQQESNDVNNADATELKDKLKSIQCEIYVLRENADKHNLELAEKQQEVKNTQSQLVELQEVIELERLESARQAEHAKYITEQNDSIQKELLQAQQKNIDLVRKLDELTNQLTLTSQELLQLKESTALNNDIKEKQVQCLRTELERSKVTIDTLNKEVNEITDELQAQEQLELELNALKVELAERTGNNVQQRLNVSVACSEPGVPLSSKLTQNDAEHLRKLNETLQRELEDLKHKSKSEITNLQQEIEDMQNIAKHMTERMAEYERLRLTEQHMVEAAKGVTYMDEKQSAQRQQEYDEKEELETKLKNIMQEVQDVSNRNLFLEQKCENFLILEQSNERLKLQNAKLSRQLDETLVSMQHNESISANTEFEYLKNIMFQYLTGTANGNNETLIKVISAVLKFSPQQTQVAIEKEHQRRSLLNKIL